MAFNIKTWTDRIAQYPSRKRLVQVSTNVYDFAREEGTVTQEGDLLNASNFNDLESRINNAFSETDTELENTKVALDKEIETNSQVNASQDRRIHLLEEASLGKLYTQDTTTSYSNDVSVPSGALSLATLDMLGGMSRKGKNLIDINSSYSRLGWSWTTPTKIENGLSFEGKTSGSTQWDMYFFSVPNELIGKQVVASCTFESNKNIGGVSLLFRNTISYSEGGFKKFVDSKTQSFVVGSQSAPEYIAIFMETDSTETQNIKLTNLQLEKGSTATPYEPYTPNLIDGKVDELISYGKNLLPNNLVSETKNGLTLTRNPNGTISVSGTVQSGLYPQFYIASVTLPKGTYYVPQQKGYMFTWVGTGIGDDNQKRNLVNTSNYDRKTFTLESTTTIYIHFVGSSNITYNYTIYPIISNNANVVVDDYVPFKEFKHYPIPSSVQALPNYGIGINNNVYNYLEYADGKVMYHERVGKYKLVENAQFSEVGTSYFNVDIVINAKAVKPNTITIGLSNEYELYNIAKSSNGEFQTDTANLSKCFQVHPVGTGLRFKDTDCANLQAFKNKISTKDIYVYYELATETITDVTDLFPLNFNELEVEPNGHISFHYPNDYKVDVPSTISYLIDLKGALNG